MKTISTSNRVGQIWRRPQVSASGQRVNRLYGTQTCIGHSKAAVRKGEELGRGTWKGIYDSEPRFKTSLGQPFQAIDFPRVPSMNPKQLGVSPDIVSRSDGAPAVGGVFPAHDSYSKPGIQKCLTQNQLRRISATISGKGIVPSLHLPGF